MRPLSTGTAGSWITAVVAVIVLVSVAPCRGRRAAWGLAVPSDPPAAVAGSSEHDACARLVMRDYAGYLRSGHRDDRELSTGDTGSHRGTGLRTGRKGGQWQMLRGFSS